ncbi:MAG: hypothetical protein AAFX02_04285, partial [Pseudomonadota bacterium]
YMPAAKYKPIEISLLHSDIDEVSDRTLREILKLLSKAIRNIEMNEVREVLTNGELRTDEINLILKSISKEFEKIPVYYLRKIEKGSLEAEVLVALGFFSALVGKITVRFATDVVTQNILYKNILAYLSGGRREKFADKILITLKDHLEKSRYNVEEISVTETKQRFLVQVEFVTKTDVENKIEKTLEYNELLNLLKRRIEETNGKKKNKSKKNKD